MKQFPSVTQVLERYADFSNIDSLRLEVAKDRGASVHALCGCYARQVWIPEVVPECQGYYDSFRRWFDQHVLKVHLAEKQLTDPVQGYTGTPDLIVTLRGDAGDSLWDIKTPVVVQKLWRLQTAAYRHLGGLQEWGEPPRFDIRRHGCIRLAQDGGNALMDEFTGTYLFDLNVFLSALNIWNFLDAE